MKYLLSLCCLILFVSCEEVIEVDLSDTEPRLVVDAILRIDTAQPSNTAEVILAWSSNFFESNTPVTDASVTLVDLNSGGTVPLTYTGADGLYTGETGTSFFRSEGIELRIVVNGILYVGESAFYPSTPITRLEQGTSNLFGEDDIEIVLGYQDNEAQDNYYYMDFDLGELFTSEDTFYQGQDFEFSYFHETAEAGDQLTVVLMGADKEMVNYLNQVLSLTGNNQGGPFQTPVSAVRGNITRADGQDPDNYPLGYFAISEAFSETLLIE